MSHPITPLDAVILGIVEGITEFLPVSSTGHLILTSHFLGLHDSDPTVKAGVNAFEIVIQSGALLAVLGIYLKSVKSILMGIIGRDPAGRALFFQLLAAFLPAVVVGFLLGDTIKDNLFGVWPVVAALAVGGILMIAVEKYRERKAGGRENLVSKGYLLQDMTIRAALFIGFAQCIAMWPGTSRSMITMVAALAIGFRPKAAAEFSFLLALPTLGAACVHDLIKEGDKIMLASGPLGLAIGFWVSCLVAWLAVKWLLNYLTNHGMAVFGWYRLAVAAVLAVVFTVS